MRTPHKILATTLGLLFACWTSSSHAADVTWSGSGSSDNWNTAGNWFGNKVPGSGYNVHFAGTTRLSPSNDIAGGSYGAIIFDSNAGSFTLGGNSLTFWSTGSNSIINNSTHAQTINLGLTTAAAKNITFQGVGDMNVTQGIAGTAGITKRGQNVLTLNGANTYTGKTEIVGGSVVLDMAAGGSLATTGTISFLTGADYEAVAGGAFVLKGKSSGTSIQSIAAMSFTSRAANQIVIDSNGGSGTTLSITGSMSRPGGHATANFNLSAPGSAVTFTTPPALTYDILRWVTVTDGTKTGYATIVSNNLQRYVVTTDLPVGTASSSGIVNYKTSGNITLGSNKGANSLTITGAGSSSGAFQLNANAILMEEGVGNYTIDNALVGPTLADFIIHQYSTSGTLSIRSRILPAASIYSVIKAGPGVMEVASGSVSDYKGATYIQGGTLLVNGQLTATGTVGIQNPGAMLKLGADNTINNAALLRSNGGILDTQGHSQTFASLMIGEGDTIIDLGNASSILNFGDSTKAWTGTLSIYNWSGTALTGGGADQLIFAGQGLTQTQLDSIKFYSDEGISYLGTAHWATGANVNEIVALTAVPEPATWAMLVGGLGLLILGGKMRRRIGAA